MCEGIVSLGFLLLFLLHIFSAIAVSRIPSIEADTFSSLFNLSSGLRLSSATCITYASQMKIENDEKKEDIGCASVVILSTLCNSIYKINY